MVKAACDAIATMAYVIPEIVLPLVYERFQVLPSLNDSACRNAYGCCALIVPISLNLIQQRSVH